ncbi:MAG: hypothetical protein SGI77_11815 [Pirellulaceae bacterium]|nr:hypothetical protein [Pirellulaceae bacterium]
MRLGRVWILCATHGKHRFFDEEGNAIRDVRKAPIHIGDYTLAVKQGGFLKKEPEADAPVADGKMRVRVQIAREKFQEYRGYFVEQACHRSSERLSKELYCLPFEPYAPVRRQLLTLLRLINERRQAAAFTKLPPTVCAINDRSSRRLNRSLRMFHLSKMNGSAHNRSLIARCFKVEMLSTEEATFEYEFFI